MKTAKEWISDYKAERRLYLDGRLLESSRKLKWLNGDLLRATQLDAYKAGMERAALIASEVGENIGHGFGELTDSEMWSQGACYNVSHAILTTAETLKSLPQ